MTIKQIKELQEVQRRIRQTKAVIDTKRTVLVQILQDRENPVKWYVLKYYKNGYHYTLKQYVGSQPAMPKAIRIHVDTVKALSISCEFV